MSSARERTFRRHRAVVGVELLEPRITPSRLTLLPASLPGVSVGQDYQVAFSATNGDGHYTYKLASGKLPKGLSFNKQGVLSGEATVAGRYRFAVRVTEPTRGRPSAVRSFSLIVSPASALAPASGPALAPAPASRFSVSAPTTTTAGAGFVVSVTAKDASGDTVVGYNGGATLTSSDGQGLDLTAPPVFVLGTALVFVTLDTADSLTLTAASGTIQGTSGPITNRPASASTFVVRAPSAATSGVGFPVMVTAEDAFGNTVSDYEGGVTLTSSDGQSVDLTAPPAFNNGTAVATVALTMADTLTLTAASGSVFGVSNSIIDSPPPAAKFVVSAPATVTAGAGFPVMLTAEDIFGGTVTGFDGDVTLTTSDGQPVNLLSPLVFDDGTAAATVSLDMADALTLTAASGSVFGVSNSIIDGPAAASTFTVSAPTTALTATGFIVTVTAKDAFGNTATGFDGVVTLSSSDGQPVDLLSPLVLTNGTAAVNVLLDTADTVTLTAAAGTIQNTSGWITVSPAPTTRFVVGAPGAVTAGVGFTVIVTAEDDSGDTLTGFDGDVTLTSSDGQPVSLLAPLVFNDGTAAATVTLDTADTLMLTAASGTMTGTSGAITDSPAAASVFVVSAPGTATVGIGFAVTITAQDAFGNTVTGFDGSVTLTSSDGQALVLLSSPAFTNGAAALNVALNTAGTVALTAASGAITGASNPIAVSTRPVMNDWFSQYMPDPDLQDLARADFTRDGSITYGDMLNLFAEAESECPLTSAALQSLQALVTTGGAAAVNMSSSVQSLTYKVVDGDPANAQFLGAPLGNLAVGSSATQLQDLVDQWFLGENLPTIDMEYLAGSSVSYLPASGTLFGTGGPSYQNVYQGSEGDCWLLASFAETAAVDPSVIQSMFTDDGTALDNGVQVHVWTVRFYDDGVTSYLTVNNELPASNGEFVYAGGFQPISASTNVLWVALLEKAYAQLCASGWNGRPQSDAYASLNAGDASTALPLITGVPESSSFPFGSASSFAGAVSSGTLLTLGSFSNAGGAETNSLGIVGDHDYAVLGYNASNQTFTLLNPWGWNNSTAPGILDLTWDQITQYFFLDGDCSPVSSVSSAAASAAGSQRSTGSPLGPTIGSADLNGFMGTIITSRKGTFLYFGEA